MLGSVPKMPSSMLTATRGTAIIDSVFDSYRPCIKGEIQGRDKGSLLAFADGTVTSFGMEGACSLSGSPLSPQSRVGAPPVL